MNLLLIDDHCLFAESLSLTLKQSMKIDCLKIAGSEKEYGEFVHRWGIDFFDIILLDVNLSNGFSVDGFELAKRILADVPKAKILLLTGYDLPVYQYEAKKIGIKGFANKNIDARSLTKIIEKIYNGEEYFSQTLVFVDVLTEREKEILSFLGQGMKRKEITSILYISERTLTNHIQNILEKLEVDSTIKAIIKAQKLGYIR
ncbi:response regulator transcription factor [Blautia sp. XA-2221]|uniref:response regulator transcription factor n=1 Tax=Blautia sp. XA-2221 TaxID=2903961 RepID=UPI002379DD50|nr:response regulator transcription factor [Blautia sp. XA-2221]